MSQVDFGVEAQLITDNQIQTQINKLQECLESAGIGLRETDINLPGEGSFIKTIIRAIEAGIITSFEPLIALINVIVEAVNAGIRAPKVFIEKIVNVVNGITELLSGLPLSIIDFIVNKILGPIVDNINIPFPSTEILIDISFGRINIQDINWKDLLDKQLLIIPPTLLKIPTDKLNEILLIFESFGDSPIFTKIIEVLLFPIDFAIGLIESVINIVSDLVTNLFSAIEKIVEIASGPVEFVIDLIGEIFGNVILKFIPDDITVSIGFKDKFIELIKDFFSGIDINISKWIDNLPDFLKTPFRIIGNLLQLISCIIKWLLGLLTPSTILGLFGISGGNVSPEFLANKWVPNNKSVHIDISDDVSSNDIKKIFKVGNKISIEINNIGYESTITRIANNQIFITNVIIQNEINDEFIVKPIF